MNLNQSPAPMFWGPHACESHIGIDAFDKSLDQPKADRVPECEADRPRVPTSVHRSETTVKSLPVQSRAQRFFHRGNERSRERLFCVLANSESGKLRRRSEKVAACCMSPSFWLRAGDEVGISLIRCRDRLCPTCAHARGLKTRARARTVVEAMDSIRFVTLTMPHTNEPLRSQLTILRLAFTKLRKSRVWKRCVTGGVATIEITRNEREKEWHPHLHALVDGDFIPHAELREAWRMALNNASALFEISAGERVIVDIRATGGRSASVAYITKYVTKPGDVLKWSDACIDEYADALAGARTLSTFGNLHARKLDAKDPNEDELKSVLICNMHAVQMRRRIGCPMAEAFVVLLCHVSDVACELFTPNAARAGPIPDEVFDDAAGTLYTLGRLFIETAPCVPIAAPWEIA